MPRLLFIMFSILIIGCGTNRGISLESNEETTPLQQYRIDHLKGLIEYEGGPITKKDLRHISFFPENEDLLLRAHFKRSEHPDTLIMPTSAGKEKTFLHFGTAYFLVDGKNVQLNVYQNVKLMSNPLYREHLFLPFKDATNGVSTYGAGRYIDLELSDISDGLITIDFNKSYNPWCAYSDGFNCPIPPLANHLEVEITAGEKAYSGKVKH